MMTAMKKKFSWDFQKTEKICYFMKLIGPSGMVAKLVAFR